MAGKRHPVRKRGIRRVASEHAREAARALLGTFAALVGGGVGVRIVGAARETARFG
jgi:hypothetical protein